MLFSINKVHIGLVGLWFLWCLALVLTIFQLYCGGQFYWWSTRRKPPTWRKSQTKLYHVMMCRRKHHTMCSVLIIYTIQRLTLSVSDDGNSKNASWARVSYKKQKSLTLREHLDLPPVFGGVRVAHLFSFLCCVCRFVCLRPNVASVSWLSIIARSVFSHVYLVKLRKMYLM